MGLLQWPRFDCAVLCARQLGRLHFPGEFDQLLGDFRADA
jgi:hypothetical protein